MMKQIQINSIEKALTIVDGANDETLDIMIDKYSSAQPALLDYILAAPTEYENENLEGLVLYYFWVIQEAFAQEGIEVNEISYETIDSFQEPYTQVLDTYFNTDDEGIIDNFCDQPHLTQFMAVEVSTDDEDGTSMDDETATQLYMVGIAMIALLNQAIKA